MDSNKNHDAEGLQAVEHNDYPEVVPAQSMPNALDGSVLASSKSFSAQTYQAGSLPSNDAKAQEYDAAQTTMPDHEYFAKQQLLQSSDPPHYEHSNEKTLEAQVTPVNEEKRVCGMRRSAFIWVSVIATLVILAAVLGGALGATLGHNNSSSTQSNSSSHKSGSSIYEAKDRTGVALLSSPGSSTVYAYYIDASGTIVETAYDNSTWGKNNTQLPQTTNITSLSAGSNSPIAAISYTLQGNAAYRQIFWFDNNGLVATANTSGHSWSSPYNPVTSLASLPDTMSLAAVAATTSNGLNGIRVYFGSSNNHIQEIGCDFPESSPNPVWHVWATFQEGDASSGVSSALVGNLNHLYLRNSSTGSLEQWTWDYVHVSSWRVGAKSTPENGVEQGGSIAVASDGLDTDYIFYQAASKHTVQALYSGSSPNISAGSTNVNSIQAAPLGYPLAASYSSGAVVMNQNSTSTADLLFSYVSRNGQAQGYSTNTGNS